MTRPQLDVTALGPISVPRLSDAIAEQIRDLIEGQDLQEGTKLPSERVLAERFGTSRPTVSQAIRTLALRGLVESRRGSGAYVLRRLDPDDVPQVPSLLSPDAGNLDALVELRGWLEGLGVQHAGAADLGGVRRALERLAESVGETSTWIAADTVFHAAVVRLAGNPVLTTLYERVHTSLLEHEYRAWVERDEVPAWLAPSEAGSQMALHEPIVAALERGDTAAALVACDRHNQVMREHLLRSPQP
ncbi:FadR/GntR family transcriptional regulator [Nocardioides aequoreus]|uniref:FadR/GntR family transcriptional regulator n=1 Tax=Nocardioides aequoreus TaxID=397278 RepID=UPI0004C2C8CF|nr:GntR family transcriptional regulator [Nocardioides aequoreus]